MTLCFKNLEISRNLEFAILTPNNFLKCLSRLKSVMQFFLSELHAKNYRFQPCAFLKFRKISEITSAVEILFYRSRRSQVGFAECSKQFCGKFPGRSASVLKKDSTSDVSRGCSKVQKKVVGAYENSNIFYKVFYADAETSKWLFRSFTLMKSCYSQRYIKIHGPQPSRPPTKYFWSKNKTCI